VPYEAYSENKETGVIDLNAVSFFIHRKGRPQGFLTRGKKSEETTNGEELSHAVDPSLEAIRSTRCGAQKTQRPRIHAKNGSTRIQPINLSFLAWTL
jgi:hypothetical protein